MIYKLQFTSERSSIEPAPVRYDKGRGDSLATSLSVSNLTLKIQIFLHFPSDKYVQISLKFS